MSSRVFIMSHQNCYGETGGGHGVNYRLYLANKKYRLFDDVYFVFKDRILHNDDECVSILKYNVRNNSGVAFLKKIIPINFLRIRQELIISNEIKDNRIRIDELNSKFDFTNKDVFVFQDYFIAYSFIEKYSFNKIAFVFHTQGSIYNEWKSLSGINSKKLEKKFDNVFKKIIKSLKILAFPSKGAEESLCCSDNSVEAIIQNVPKRYLYNGVFCPTISDTELCTWVKDIKNFGGFRFVTVANLNEAKAVERIPQFLGKLLNSGINFKWILVGNGVKAEVVEEQINKYNLSSNVIWRKEFLRHEEILQLFSVTDFYILFQKFSIFDLSTLEAMHYGNIPILTPVGGNKEVIIDGNGLFVEDFGNVDELEKIIYLNRIDELKEKNIKIQNELFDDKMMLNRYVELVKELTEF